MKKLIVATLSFSLSAGEYSGLPTTKSAAKVHMQKLLLNDGSLILGKIISSRVAQKPYTWLENYQMIYFTVKVDSYWSRGKVIIPETIEVSFIDNNQLRHLPTLIAEKKLLLRIKQDGHGWTLPSNTLDIMVLRYDGEAKIDYIMPYTAQGYLADRIKLDDYFTQMEFANYSFKDYHSSVHSVSRGIASVSGENFLVAPPLMNPLKHYPERPSYLLHCILLIFALLGTSSHYLIKYSESDEE
jgi:hypothetical protein